MEEQITILIAFAGLFGVPLMCAIFCLCVDNMDRRPTKRMTQKEIDYYDRLLLK